MVRNTLQQDGIEEKLKEAIFEPKMTRSKVKEVIEKGEIIPNWNLPSLKTLHDPLKVPNFLEISFSDNDDENDDEYKPNPNELNYASDDEDTNVSSMASDFGSPPPLSVPSTPLSIKNSILCSTPEHSMTPGRPVDQTIASRTRSKLPLKDTPLEAIESTFVAPDITPDMYNTQCDNEDWQEFLSELMKTSNTMEPTEDDNDSEYNFLAEAEKEEVDEEDYRNDKAVKVSKKELNELMDELFEAYGLEDKDEDNSQEPKYSPCVVTVETDITSSNTKSPVYGFQSHSGRDGSKQTKDKKIENMKLYASSQCPVFIPPLQLDGPLVQVLVSDIMKAGEQASQHISPVINDDLKVPDLAADERVQIKDQMRKHIQLLSQTFIQSSRYNGDSEKQMAARMSKLFLVELKALGDKTSLPGNVVSVFHEVNLDGALAVTDMDFGREDQYRNEILREALQSRNGKDRLLSEDNFTYEQMEAIVTNKVFLFPQMIPETCFQLNQPSSEKVRVCFTEAEDNLLAIGLDQFGSSPKKYILIHEFMLPTKKRFQLKNRVKNLKAHKYEHNAVKAYFNSKRLPVFPRYAEIENERKIVPPEERDPELLPAWWVPFCEARKLMQKDICTDTALKCKVFETWNMPSGSVANDACTLITSNMPFHNNRTISSAMPTETVGSSQEAMEISRLDTETNASLTLSMLSEKGGHPSHDPSKATTTPSHKFIPSYPAKNHKNVMVQPESVQPTLEATSSDHFLSMSLTPLVDTGRNFDSQNIQLHSFAMYDVDVSYCQREPQIKVMSGTDEIDKREKNVDKWRHVQVFQISLLLIRKCGLVLQVHSYFPLAQDLGPVVSRISK